MTQIHVMATPKGGRASHALCGSPIAGVFVRSLGGFARSAPQLCPLCRVAAERQAVASQSAESAAARAGAAGT
jgi:hypothetical protein